MKRKAATRRRRRSTRKSSRRILWIIPLIALAAAVLGYFGVSSFYRPGADRQSHRARIALETRQLREPNLGRIPVESAPFMAEWDPRTSARLASAVERSGGSEIWVRHHSGQVEILAPAAAVSRTLAAISDEARRCGLESRIGGGHSVRSGARLTKIDLARNGRVLGIWRVREVERILRAAIIIDDLGQELIAAHRLIELPYPITFSVLPHLAHSTDTARAAHAAGREIMLHLPMEPQPGSSQSPGAGMIAPGMAYREVAEVVGSDLATVPYARGVNNHMGSRATSDAVLMTEVMKVLAARRLYFVDSRTTPLTVAQDVAVQAGVPNLARSVFLDDTQSVGCTLAELRRFCKMVEQNGSSLAIGHPYASTITALRDFLPEFDRLDIELVPASQLVGKAANPSLQAASVGLPR